MLGKNGFFKKTVQYDQDGNPIDAAFFDTAGQPLRTEVFVIDVVPGGTGTRSAFGRVMSWCVTVVKTSSIAPLHRSQASGVEEHGGGTKELQFLRDGVLLKGERRPACWASSPAIRAAENGKRAPPSGSTR